jgi:plasmid maintenance system killer protein
MGYVLLMIRNFKGKFAEPILQGRMVPKGFPANLAKVARRKLIVVDAAASLEALNSPPGNRLEALKGDLAGSTRSASTINGGSCSGGPMRVPKTWR